MTLFFGSEIGRGAPTPTSNHVSGDIASAPQSDRKPSRDATINGLLLDLPASAPAPKRGRRSNGTDATNASADAMQVEQNGYDYGEREPPEPVSPGNYSVAEDEQVNGMDIDEDANGSATGQDLEPIRTLTEGQSVGIQSDKVLDLTPHTSILTMPDRDNIMHTTWNPRNPEILATGGDALCRLWPNIKVAALADQDNDKSYRDIMPPTDSYLVTSMAWSPDGKILAVATRADASDWTGSVSTWTDEGKALDDLIAGQDMVIKLRWNATGTLLLGITSNGDGGSSLIVWEMQSSQPFRPIPCDKVITDADWTGDWSITVCGQGAIGRCDLSSEAGLTWVFGKDPAIASRRWSYIRYDSVLGITAVADEENACLVFINAQGGVSGKDAHKDAITSMVYQPLLNTTNMSSQTSRLLVTSSLDGTIKYWDAQTARHIHTLNVPRDSPALAIAFSPDGRLLAAASFNKVLVWNTGDGGLPKASWGGELGKSPKMTLTNGNGADRDSGIGDDEDGMSEPNYSLDWDAEGKNLAVGVGNQVRVNLFESR